MLKNEQVFWPYYKTNISSSDIDKLAKLNPPYKIDNAKVGAGTYIASNAIISMAQIGKFCSIGPNFFVVGGYIRLKGFQLHQCFIQL